MAQKTRKEKIASSARKQQRLQYTYTTTPAPVKAATQSTATVSPSVKREYVLTEEEKQLKKFFYADLRKSLILVAVIFTLEFILYYATINNYLKI